MAAENVKIHDFRARGNIVQWSILQSFVRTTTLLFSRKVIKLHIGRVYYTSIGESGRLDREDVEEGRPREDIRKGDRRDAFGLL